MLRLPGGSLRTKLLLLSFLLVAVPGAVFALIATGSSRRALERAVGRQLAEVAQDTADGVTSEVLRLQDEVLDWSRQASLRDLDGGDAGERVSRLLAALARGDPALSTLSATDASGRIVAASDPARIGEQLSARAWWGVVQRGQAVIGEPDPLQNGKSTLEVAAPIFGRDQPNEVRGAVVAAYRWEQMTGILEHLQHDLAAIGLEVSLLLLDGRGRVVAGGWWQEPSELIGQNLRARGWRAPVLAASASRPAYLHDRAADALIGYDSVKIPNLGWATLAVQPVDNAFAPVRVLRHKLLLALDGVLLVGLALAVLIANRLSRPIRELTEATRALARTGEASGPVAVRTRDEIGDLAIAFNRMADQLTRARDDLVAAAKFAFVGEIAAGITHEVRTPLGILRSSAQILGRSLPPGDQRSAELVEMIVSEVDRLDRLIAGLLEIARPHEPLLESVQLASVLSRALDFLESRAHERGIALNGELDRPIRPALCDPEEIYQVALNLVVNALQILPRGGTVTVRTIARDGRVGFDVCDDGPGIPPEDQERVFTPFFTRRPGGTGLGLALVQRVVRSHNGTVSVDSVVGHGTTFRVELPVATEAP